jgi:hypothetical protein
MVLRLPRVIQEDLVILVSPAILDILVLVDIRVQALVDTLVLVSPVTLAGVVIRARERQAIQVILAFLVGPAIRDILASRGILGGLESQGSLVQVVGRAVIRVLVVGPVILVILVPRASQVTLAILVSQVILVLVSPAILAGVE